MDTSPAGMIARLDASLARVGEDVVLRRNTLGPGNTQIPFDATVRGHVRRQVRTSSAEEMAAGFQAHEERLILSPTDLDRTGWPGPEVLGQGQVPATEDRRLPINGDIVIVAGRARRIDSASGIRIAGILVRVEARLVG